MQRSENLQKINNTNNRKRQYHVGLSEENYNKLRNLGTCGDSFNDVLTKILNHESGLHKINIKEGIER